MMREDRMNILREERLKKLMRAGRPEPTPNFTSRVYRTLDRLPDKKPGSALRFVPVSAVAVVAFAAFCVLIIHFAGQGQAPGNGQLAAGGMETAQPAASASPPYPYYMQTISITSTDNGITQTIAQAGTDGNVLCLSVGYEPAPDAGRITWSLSIDGKPHPCFEHSSFNAEGSDFYEFIIPLSDPIIGSNTRISLSSAVIGANGKDAKASFQADFTLPVCRDAIGTPTPCPTPEPNYASGFVQPLNISRTDKGLTETLMEAGTDGNVLYLKFKNMGTPKEKYLSDLKVLVNGAENAEDYATHGEADAWSVKIPLTVKIDGANADIGVTYTLSEDAGGGKVGATIAQFHFAFILPVYAPEKVSASGSGTIAFGNRAEVDGVYKSMDFVTCSLKVADNEAGDLEKYFQKFLGRPSQPGDRVLLSGGNQPTAYDIAICKGLVGKDYIDQYVENDAFRMAIYVGDGDGLGHGIYARFIFTVLERAADGGYVLNVINLNPTYRPASGFTLITKEYTYVAFSYIRLPTSRFRTPR
jgi:hypothetical protein